RRSRHSAAEPADLHSFPHDALPNSSHGRDICNPGFEASQGGGPLGCRTPFGPDRGFPVLQPVGDPAVVRNQKSGGQLQQCAFPGSFGTEHRSDAFPRGGGKIEKSNQTSTEAAGACLDYAKMRPLNPQGISILSSDTPIFKHNRTPERKEGAFPIS